LRQGEGLLQPGIEKRIVACSQDLAEFLDTGFQVGVFRSVPQVADTANPIIFRVWTRARRRPERRGGADDAGKISPLTKKATTMPRPISMTR
jgi:hypothetical protein